MAWLARLLVGFLLQAVGSLVARVLIALGISAVTYTGVSQSIDFAASFIVSHWAALPALATQILGALRIGTDISIIIGCITARLTLSGLTSTGLSKWAMKVKTGSSTPMPY